MRLVILGATGGIGKHLVSTALARGHAVTAAVRSPAKITLRDPGLTVLHANPLEAASLKEAVRDADAVVSGMGAPGRRDPLKAASTSARAAAEAMATSATRRLIVVSAGPLNRTGDGLSWVSRRMFSPLLWAILREVYTDLERMENFLAASDLDWTVVRPPRLTDADGKGRYRHLIEGGPAGSSIARADVAQAMLDFLDLPETIGHAVGVSD
ncbi:epimerase [Prauserella marina]|uniref:Putative NADH-flavin reductase n=1 Tax=Prauserella marina TaxID=530584 RepID=A0A222VPP9_9PSEU|nr:NAD(P)H-binding protein [Prauserella marina]ASR35877.1 epimerase [Prauserella marina]PWV84203.1 putative NADH-flavin reductase [Prauserella marina]SDC28137.1 Putative NADH-flavin reductase [Prauserella marina]